MGLGHIQSRWRDRFPSHLCSVQNPLQANATLTRHGELAHSATQQAQVDIASFKMCVRRLRVGGEIENFRLDVTHVSHVSHLTHLPGPRIPTDPLLRRGFADGDGDGPAGSTGDSDSESWQELFSRPGHARCSASCRRGLPLSGQGDHPATTRRAAAACFGLRSGDEVPPHRPGKGGVIPTRPVSNTSTNDGVEWASGVISETLQAYANGRKEDWDDHLPLAVFAIHSAESTLGCDFTEVCALPHRPRRGRLRLRCASLLMAISLRSAQAERRAKPDGICKLLGLKYVIIGNNGNNR